MSNNYKNFSELDFDKIKNSLKEFLKNQDEFTDYNFEGSAINVLLDILSYNTLYNSFYANMTISERFLQYAQTRKSNVSLARNIGYITRSSKSAKARIKLEITSSDATPPASIFIPKGTVFVGKNSDGSSLKFYTNVNYFANPISGVYTTTVDIYEGKNFNYSYEIKEGENGVIIPNKGVDTELIKVNVKDSKTSTNIIEYSLCEDYTLVKGTDYVYFIEEVDGEKYRIYFGDNIVGVGLNTGNVVNIEYQISSGEIANNIKSFSLSSQLIGTNSVKITTIDNSYGGSDIESLESIKQTAPQFYQIQNRAVTYLDYKYIVKRDFPNVLDVSAWGGEDSDPPIYGKVFISIKPRYTEFLSDNQKVEIEDFLSKNYSIVSIKPVVVDPDYLYLHVTSTVYYDSTKSNPGPNEIKSSVITSIENFNNDYINSFGLNFRYSKFIGYIDASSNSIESNKTKISISKKLLNFNNLSVDNKLIFNTSLNVNSINSNLFNYSIYTNVFISDDSLGNLYLYRYINSIKDYILDLNGNKIKVGTIDYIAGTIVFDVSVLNGNNIIYINNDDDLEIFADSDLNDIVTLRNQIITINFDTLKVKVVDNSTGISV